MQFETGSPRSEIEAEQAAVRALERFRAERATLDLETGDPGAVGTGQGTRARRPGFTAAESTVSREERVTDRARGPR